MSSTAVERKSMRWVVDPGTTAVEFEVKTFWGLMTVRGRFDRFDGSYEYGSNGESITLTIEADSLDTGHATRDRHLRSDDFFHVVRHPHVWFTSTRIDHVSDGTLQVEGRLQAAGRVVPLRFTAALRAIADGFEIEATTTLDQRRLGMSSGRLGMIRPPVTLHVRARLAPAGEPGA